MWWLPSHIKTFFYLLCTGKYHKSVAVLSWVWSDHKALARDPSHLLLSWWLFLNYSLFQDALNLPQRPFAHNTTLIIIGAALLYLLVYISTPLLGNSFIKDLPLMFVISTLSHHLRDADRRGIWLGPFFSTPPIPYKLYPFLITLLPTVLPLPRLLPVFFKALVEMSAVFMRPKTPPEISNVWVYLIMLIFLYLIAFLHSNPFCLHRGALERG